MLIRKEHDEDILISSHNDEQYLAIDDDNE